MRTVKNTAVPSSKPSNIVFTDIGAKAGLTSKTIHGGEKETKHAIENMGCGVAWLDFNNDGWLDLFLVNGTKLNEQEGAGVTNRLYQNDQNGKFTDVTQRAGLWRSGWGQGVCAGDYDNDGSVDLFVTYFGYNVLYHNNGDGTFTDLTAKAGVGSKMFRWGSGCGFIDYDRDGYIDLFVANYLDADLSLPADQDCRYFGVKVPCGPNSYPGVVNLLYHNQRDGTFKDVSKIAGITKSGGKNGLGVVVSDFNNDGWPDIYVANDRAPSTLYRNNRNGTFNDIGILSGTAYDANGALQAGMGAAAGDYNGDGLIDIFKTNFSGETSSLYRNLGNMNFEDVAVSAGVGENKKWVGWGCGFEDLDNDSWPDIFLVNGHVYPEVDMFPDKESYAQPKVLYHNKSDGTFTDITATVGATLLTPSAARGCAFGDFDNDGDIDICINPINSYPILLRNDSATPNNWLTVSLTGVSSNRSGIGARIRVTAGGRTQVNEVRSGSSYYSHNDLRVHFGLGKARGVEKLEVIWPGGHIDVLNNISANRLIKIEEKRSLRGRI